MILLITQADLPDYTRMSRNIDASQLSPYIRDAHVFDVLPQLRPAEVAALAALVGLPASLAAFALLTPEAQAAAPLSAAALAYQAYTLLPAEAQPLEAGHALYTLYFEGVRPLLCYHTYRRFLLDHGAHITPNGLETISDAGHMPISGQQRNEMRADAQAKCAHYQAALAIHLRAYRSPAGPSCTPSTRRPRSGGLTASAI